jgi:RND superfamily putative drug exporter
VAQAIVARPGVILVSSFLLLAVPAWSGLAVPVTYDFLSELSSDRISVRGTRLLAQYFPVGETGPISVLAYDPTARFDTAEGKRRISLLTKELCDLTYTDSSGAECRPVLSVRSLTNPLGDPPGAFSPFSPAGRRKMAALNHPKAKAMFLSATPQCAGTVTRLDVISQYDPFSKEGMRLVGEIERRLLASAADPESPWHGTSFDLTGITAGIRDLEAVNTSDFYRIGTLVSIAVLGVLVFLLRRPLVSLYLIFTVLFGFFVTLGITKMFFQWMYGPTFEGVDWKLPIFLFVILVAVGEDYNIYLVTRVYEEQRKRGLLEGLRVAVARTGGIITSCGVIMAGTFASMLTGTLRGMFELGFSLSLGVLLDTFVIRTVLVPAFLALMARWSSAARGPETKQASPRVLQFPKKGRRAA